MKHLILALMLVAMPASGATPTDTTVAFYHGAPDRAGNYIVPGLDWRSAGAVRGDQSFDGHVEGHIYAQPLYWRPPGAERGLIIAATESDFVYALDAATGRVMWRTALGRAVPGAALPCGNIDPLGVTGTPVIDAARGTVYLDAMIDDRGTRGTSSTACGLPTAACRPASRSTLPRGSRRAASGSTRWCKTNAGRWHC